MFPLRLTAPSWGLVPPNFQDVFRDTWSKLGVNDVFRVRLLCRSMPLRVQLGFELQSRQDAGSRA